MWEWKEKVGTWGRSSSLHHALQPRRIHGYDASQQERNQKEGPGNFVYGRICLNYSVTKNFEAIERTYTMSSS